MLAPRAKSTNPSRTGRAQGYRDISQVDLTHGTCSNAGLVGFGHHTLLAAAHCTVIRTHHFAWHHVQLPVASIKNTRRMVVFHGQLHSRRRRQHRAKPLLRSVCHKLQCSCPRTRTSSFAGASACPSRTRPPRRCCAAAPNTPRLAIPPRCNSSARRHRLCCLCRRQYGAPPGQDICSRLYALCKFCGRLVRLYPGPPYATTVAAQPGGFG